ncbi:JAB domain-containing protein [Vibrio crassostreae]|nr:JAB domain-containing protein [Vibrio crassostreae]CAK1763422.1 JAB domain-containing protein [Vibrio crassostreae]CAK2194068.1 JAB domain-containing protein [Vibrio crassostreae]CAK2284688.1 JAB domain-containing protein [Vibrio crassostreae]CAK2558527.1 JAB domain-containing protein [Vibrio crassostreae]
MGASVVIMETENWFIESEEYGDFEIKAEVIDTLISHRQLRSQDLEAGGALIGCIHTSGKMQSSDLTTPQPTDRRSRCSFFRSSAHNHLLNEKWKSSNGNAYLVGLWHTHPEPIPNYSNEDKRDWIKVLKQGQYEGKHLMFLIVGQRRMRLWVIDNESFRTSLIGEYSFEK